MHRAWWMWGGALAIAGTLGFGDCGGGGGGPGPTSAGATGATTGGDSGAPDCPGACRHADACGVAFDQDTEAECEAACPGGYLSEEQSLCIESVPCDASAIDAINACLSGGSSSTAATTSTGTGGTCDFIGPGDPPTCLVFNPGFGGEQACPDGTSGDTESITNHCGQDLYCDLDNYDVLTGTDYGHWQFTVANNGTTGNFPDCGGQTSGRCVPVAEAAQCLPPPSGSGPSDAAP